MRTFRPRVTSAITAREIDPVNDQDGGQPGVLKTGTSDGSGKPTLTDLITTLPANQQYTYDFDGVSEVLDHILITKGIGMFTYQVSDHDPQVVDIKTLTGASAPIRHLRSRG